MFLGVQVETMLSITGFEGRSLVAQASLSGDKATFEAVTTALVTRLRSEQVRYRLFSLPISLMKRYWQGILLNGPLHILVEGIMLIENLA